MSDDVYHKYVVPIHDLLDYDNLWIDKEDCKLHVESTDDQKTRIHGCFTLKDSDAFLVFQNLYNSSIRKEVDTTIVEFKTIETIDDKTDVLYHHSSFPLNVLSQRDAVIWRHILEHDKDRGVYTIVWLSCEHPDYPERDHIVRIYSSGCYRVIQQEDHVDVYSLVFSDLGGSIPMSVVRVSSVPLLLAFRNSMEDRCTRR